LFRICENRIKELDLFKAIPEIQARLADCKETALQRRRECGCHEDEYDSRGRRKRKSKRKNDNGDDCFDNCAVCGTCDCGSGANFGRTCKGCDDCGDIEDCTKGCDSCDIGGC
jgi:hypothetical protein